MSTSKKSSRKWLLFLFTLPSILCLSFYFFVIRKPFTENEKPIFNKLNYFGKKTIKDNDTVYFAIDNFEALTQNGEPFGADIVGKYSFVASFVNYNDKMTTPRVLGQLYAAQEKMKHLKETYLVSFNTAPNKDGIQQMLLLANKVHAQKHKWFFLETKSDNFEIFAHKNFWLFGDSTKFEMNDLMHTLFLIDKEKHVRGIYDATYVEDVKRLIDEAVVLDSEYRFKKHKASKH